MLILGSGEISAIRIRADRITGFSAPKQVGGWNHVDEIEYGFYVMTEGRTMIASFDTMEKAESEYNRTVMQWESYVDRL